MVNRRFNSQGYTLVELSIAVLILAAMAGSVMMARTFVAKQTVNNQDQAYATQKAIQMFEELKALAAGNVAVLDNYSDGSQFNTVLTTDKNVDTWPPSSGNAGNALSGNRKTNGHWRYLRQVAVNKVAYDSYVRQVIINVFLYASDTDPSQGGKLLATVGGELRTNAPPNAPTQVMDVYVLAIQTIQGWWSQIPTLYDTMQSIIGDLQARNPGLVIRTHYITRTSFGEIPNIFPLSIIPMERMGT